MQQRGRILGLRPLVSSVFLLAGLLVAPATANAANSGTIDATVTGAAPCITVSGSFAFGTLPFSQAGHASSKTVSGGSATNCGAQDEVFLANLSAATNGGTTWTVQKGGDPCGVDGTQRNVYEISITNSDPNNFALLQLSDTDQTFLTGVAASGNEDVNGAIVMPCTGSDGAGLVMSATITLTATF